MFIKIEKVLYKNLKQSGLQDQIDTQQILEVAVEVIAGVIGDKAKVQIKALRLDQGSLYLSCLSDQIAQRCKQFERKIINELNAPFSRRPVKKLVVKL